MHFEDLARTKRDCQANECVTVMDTGASRYQSALLPKFFRDGKFVADRSLSGQCSRSLSDRFSERSSSVRVQVQPGECFIRVVRWNQKQVYTLD